ncbi:hypothetical protein Pla175_04710 [Pirellulimonas nuda]|uniref:DUF8091 domain-containing protein n=1 Tax=Pirellulimonas nuda TaxID=2528009 RepID=A0A518D6N2_9BACT|nr:hypothetical protein [Pirellulimonas nuda]QDU87116.1 hypothetical protein Pla175_04710 [Pirellulimonas nuda]
METSLHQQLKAHYAGASGEIEVRLGRFRIDVVLGDELIEIQHGGLAAIRDKIRKLCETHPVRVVKPIVARKQIIKYDKQGGQVVSSRLSPKRGAMINLFDELLHFTRAFPHPRLKLEAVLVEVEEHRSPGHGRRRRWRKNDFVVDDQRLAEVGESVTLRRAADLLKLLPAIPRGPFDTGALAQAIGEQRWVAQRIAYVLRHTGAIHEVGKQGNARLYRRGAGRRRAA